MERLKRIKNDGTEVDAEDYYREETETYLRAANKALKEDDFEQVQRSCGQARLWCQCLEGAVKKNKDAAIRATNSAKPN